MNQTTVRDDVPQTTFTKWHNPTKHVQRVVLDTGRGGPNAKFAFVVNPGETRELDSIYSRAIQHIDCGQEECHKKYGGGYYCTNPDHAGVIQGGLAPLLRRVGKGDQLLPILDPEAVEKARVEQALQAAMKLQDAQDRAFVTAAAQLEDRKRAAELQVQRTAAAEAVEAGTKEDGAQGQGATTATHAVRTRKATP